jgi:hypothetical protein
MPWISICKISCSLDHKHRTITKSRVLTQKYRSTRRDILTYSVIYMRYMSTQQSGKSNWSTLLLLELTTHSHQHLQYKHYWPDYVRTIYMEPQMVCCHLWAQLVVTRKNTMLSSSTQTCGQQVKKISNAWLTFPLPLKFDIWSNLPKNTKNVSNKQITNEVER